MGQAYLRMLGPLLHMYHEDCVLFCCASFCPSVPCARQPWHVPPCAIMACANVQRSVTDAQPLESFGSGLLFPSTEEGPAHEDIVDLTVQDQVPLFPC